MVGTVVPAVSSNDVLLAPLPAANPAPTLAATISVNDWAPVECPGVTALDSKESSSVELGVPASPPGPTMPPLLAIAVATAAAERADGKKSGGGACFVVINRGVNIAYTLVFTCDVRTTAKTGILVEESAFSKAEKHKMCTHTYLQRRPC